MPRARPVHNLRPEEARMVEAIAAPNAGAGERAKALRLKARIEDYWRARGFAVDVKLVDGPFERALRAARVDLRSNFPAERAG